MKNLNERIGLEVELAQLQMEVAQMEAQRRNGVSDEATPINFGRPLRAIKERLASLETQLTNSSLSLST